MTHFIMGQFEHQGCYTETFAPGLGEWTLVSGSTAYFEVRSDGYDGNSCMYGGPISSSGATIKKDLGQTVNMASFEGYVQVFAGSLDDDAMDIELRDPTDTFNVLGIVAARDSVVDGSQRLYVSGDGITPFYLGSAMLTAATWFRVRVTLANGVGACTLTVTNAATGVVFGSTTFTQVTASRDVRYMRFHIESASFVHPGATTRWSLPTICP